MPFSFKKRKEKEKYCNIVSLWGFLVCHQIEAVHRIQRRLLPLAGLYQIQIYIGEGMEEKSWLAVQQSRWCIFHNIPQPSGWTNSVSCNLWGLSICCLIGGLDEHGLGDVLAGRHGHLLDLVELLEENKQGDPLRFPLQWIHSNTESQHLGTTVT